MNKLKKQVQKDGKKEKEREKLYKNQLMMTNFVMDDTASRMKNIITSYEEKINELQKLIDEKDSIIRQKESELRKKELEIYELNEKINKYKNNQFNNMSMGYSMNMGNKLII